MQAQVSYKEALELFNLKDVYTVFSIPDWSEDLEKKYRELLIEFSPKTNDKKKIAAYQLVLQAYKVLKSQITRHAAVREDLPSYIHTEMSNGFLPNNFNPEDYKRDTHRAEIQAPDFITNTKDFHSVFDYNIKKMKSLDETIRSKAFNLNDTYAAYGQNQTEQEYQPMFEDTKVEYENKRYTLEPVQFKYRDLKKEREDLDNELRQEQKERQRKRK